MGAEAEQGCWPRAALSPSRGDASRAFTHYYRRFCFEWTELLRVFSVPHGASWAWSSCGNSSQTGAQHVCHRHAHTRSPQEFLKEKNNYRW